MHSKEKREHYKVFCMFDGTFLQEAKHTTSSMICPCCGREIVISIRNRKLTLFENRRRPEHLPAYKAALINSCLEKR